MVITSFFLRLSLAFITGAIGTLSFSPYDFWPAAIISLGSLLLVTLDCNSKQAGYLGFIWGFGLFSTGINWIYISIEKFSNFPNIVNILIVLLLAAYLSLYPMLFATLLVKFWPNTNLWRLSFGAAVLWSITEFLRGRVFSGFPWLEFGYSQIDGPLKGIAPILGVQAITFILIMISGLAVLSLARQRWLPALIALALLLLPWPLALLKWYYYQPNKSIDIALVQGNIDQSIKWNPSHINQTLDIYLQNTLPIIGKTQLIIWPESAIPDEEIAQNKFLIQLDKQLRQHNTNLITGIIDARPSSHGCNYYNSIIVLGESVPYQYPSKNRYNKHHLVPFGEVVPFKRFLKQLSPLFNLPMSSLSSGQYLQPQLQIANMKLTATVCYEIIIGNQVRDNFRYDTDFLLTISNDAWFGNSIGPWQHFQMARMRSLELGRPLLCCTNNGITAVINSDGIPLAQLQQFTRDVLNVHLTPTQGLTPYACINYWQLWVFKLLIGLLSLFFDRQESILKNITQLSN